MNRIWSDLIDFTYRGGNELRGCACEKSRGAAFIHCLKTST